MDGTKSAFAPIKKTIEIYPLNFIASFVLRSLINNHVIRLNGTNERVKFVHFELVRNKLKSAGNSIFHRVLYKLIFRPNAGLHLVLSHAENSVRPQLPVLREQSKQNRLRRFSKIPCL